jgi:hypothetical protein
MQDVLMHPYAIHFDNDVQYVVVFSWFLLLMDIASRYNRNNVENGAKQEWLRFYVWILFFILFYFFVIFFVIRCRSLHEGRSFVKTY